MKRTALRRSSWMPRGTKPLKANRARKAKRFQRDFGGAEYRAYIVGLPCAICGVAGFSDPAHAKSRGAGGDASDLVPLCHVRPSSVVPDEIYPGCHHNYDTSASVHAAFKDRLRPLARSLRSEWLENNSTEIPDAPR